jgi:hypothetical protein
MPARVLKLCLDDSVEPIGNEENLGKYQFSEQNSCIVTAKSQLYIYDPTLTISTLLIILPILPDPAPSITRVTVKPYLCLRISISKSDYEIHQHASPS